VQLILTRFIGEVSNRLAVGRKGGEALGRRGSVSDVTSIACNRIYDKHLAASPEYDAISGRAGRDPFERPRRAYRARLQFRCVGTHSHVALSCLTASP